MDELEIIRHRQIEGLSMFFDTCDYRTPHFHPEWELLWVLDQPLAVSSGQETFVLHEGELLLFNPNVPHEFHKVVKGCTFLCMQISSSLFPTAKHLQVESLRPGEYLTPEQDERVKREMLRTARSYFSHAPHYEMECVSLAGLILHELLTTIPSHQITAEEAANRDRRNARLVRLLQFVDENYMHKIRLSDFAEQEGCSMSYLSHFIKAALNQTFQEYVNSVRFNCACKLIASGKYKMLDVCMESGFSDYRYFSRTFRQQCGMTPEEYSRQVELPVQEEWTVRHSLHSLERFYSREQSIALVEQFGSRKVRGV